MHADRHSMQLWQGRIDPEADSPRWHQRIRSLTEDSQPGLALLGFASDEGVRRNHGRVGAANGPLVIRKALANLAWHRKAPAYDAGDVVCADGDLESAQARLGHNVCALLDAGHLPIVLGGGHEVAFGSWSGLAEHLSGLDVSFDLADLRGYAYYTGMRFSLFARSERQAGTATHAELVRGGRYDEVGAIFGRKRPAVGFSLDLKELVQVSPRRTLKAAVRAPWGNQPGLREAIVALRAAGETVVCALPGHDHEVDEFHCDRVLTQQGGGWAVQPV